MAIDLQELFEERAAIMEYDGGMTREQAEIEAWKDIMRNYGEKNGANKQNNQ